MHTAFEAVKMLSRAFLGALLIIQSTASSQNCATLLQGPPYPTQLTEVTALALHLLGGSC
jgi:hypothetical protein